MDRIVAATPYRDYVLVFTESGVVYRVWSNPITDQIEVRKELEIVSR